MSEVWYRYPWDTWLDGGVHSIRRDEDYACTTSSMVTQIYAKAKSRNLKATVHREGDLIVMAAAKGDARAILSEWMAQNLQDGSWPKVLWWLSKRKEDLEEQAARRGLPADLFAVHMLEDVFDVYAEQKDSEIEEMLEEISGAKQEVA